MSGTMFRLVPLAALLAMTSTALSAEPEKLPPPRQVPTVDGQPLDPYTGFYRTSRYDVWQYYAVDNKGTWRPRVVYTPDGFRYLYNGAPYLYGSTRQLDFTPVASGTPYSAAPAFMPYCPED